MIVPNPRMIGYNLSLSLVKVGILQADALVNIKGKGVDGYYVIQWCKVFVARIKKCNDWFILVF